MPNIRVKNIRIKNELSSPSEETAFKLKNSGDLFDL
jgi:hypothetical protein